MSDKCFVCLDIARNNPCPHCNIRAHHKCWGRFLKNTLKRDDPEMYEDRICFVTTKEFKCPQCKGAIKSHQRLTRSETLERRMLIANMRLSNIYDKWGESNIKSKDNLFHSVMEFISKNKWMVNNSKFAGETLKGLKMFHAKGTPQASYYHLKIFNKHIGN